MEPKNTILIADDEEIHRKTLGILLSNQGYKLVFAKNGREALTLAAKLTPDVILLDVMMPDIDGFEVCLTLRANTSLAEIPIIIVTTLDDQKLRQKGIEAGADEFISKPFNHAELRARIRTITKLNRYRRLVAEKAKFEHVVEQASEGYLILNHQDQILYANPKARLYFDLPKDKFVTDTFVVQAAKRYQREPQESWMTWSDAQDKPRYLVRSETPTAKAFWLQISVTKISSGTDEQLLVCLSDVTDSIFSERLKWTVRSQISHKFRTPLTPLVSGLEYLTDEHSKISGVKRGEYLKGAYEAAVCLQNEIEEVFQYMDIQNMVKTVDILCSVADILSIIHTFKDILDSESVHIFHESFAKPEAMYVTLTHSAVELILREIFVNAKKFHPNGTPELTIDIAAVSGNIRLKISDDGLTLSPEQLANIWTSYYQGEKYFTGGVAGMGLGLSMVASLIWEVGGTCRAYNRTDSQGIVIELVFPLN